MKKLRSVLALRLGCEAARDRDGIAREQARCIVRSRGRDGRRVISSGGADTEIRVPDVAVIMQRLRREQPRRRRPALRMTRQR